MARERQLAVACCRRKGIDDGVAEVDLAVANDEGKILSHEVVHEMRHTLKLMVT